MWREAIENVENWRRLIVYRHEAVLVGDGGDDDGWRRMMEEKKSESYLRGHGRSGETLNSII